MIDIALKKSYKQLNFFLFYNEKLKKIHKVFVAKRVPLGQFRYMKKMNTKVQFRRNLKSRIIPIREKKSIPLNLNQVKQKKVNLDKK